MSEEIEMLRKKVALQHGIQLYEHYREKEVCAFLGNEISALKRWRTKGLIPYVPMGPRHVRYFGYQIVDMLINGVPAKENGDWPSTQSENSKSGSTILPSETIPRRGTAAGLKTDAPNAHRLAQTILGKPKKP